MWGAQRKLGARHTQGLRWETWRFEDTRRYTKIAKMKTTAKHVQTLVSAVHGRQMEGALVEKERYERLVNVVAMRCA